MSESHQRCLVKLTRLLRPADQMQRLDQPERADVEGRFRQAEIVFIGITQHMWSASQRSLDRLERGEEARVIRREEAKLDHLQQAGIELPAAEAGSIVAEVR